MTDQQHPITPPDELVEQWHRDALKSDPTKTVAQCIATQAARWGADQELEASINRLILDGWGQAINGLRAARRPKPKSQAEEALTALERWAEDEYGEVGLIRAALERLRELEGGND